MKVARSFDLTGSSYSVCLPKDGWIDELHTSISQCDCTVFISRALVLNGLHTPVGCKSSGPTQVCSPVSSKGCKECSQQMKKEYDIYVLLPRQHTPRQTPK